MSPWPIRRRGVPHQVPRVVVGGGERAVTLGGKQAALLPQPDQWAMVPDDRRIGTGTRSSWRPDFDL